MAKQRKSNISIDVTLDENKVPDSIHWHAEDGGVKEEAKAMLLSMWNADRKETLKIDLWTKDMTMDDMKIFFHQTMVAMSKSFELATQDERMGATMRDFCDYFAEKMDLKKDQ